MVIEMSTRGGRPKRLAAVKGVQHAVQTLTKKTKQTSGSGSQPKSGSIKKRRTSAVLKENPIEPSDESEEDNEDDSEDDDENEDEYRPAKKAKTSKEKSQSRKSTAMRPIRRGGNKENLSIDTDNRLFNAVKDTQSDLKEVAQEWMTSYTGDHPVALAEFINFALRACGSNESIDGTQVEDTDNVVEVLEGIQNLFKKANIPSYPLISKAPGYRKFRFSMSKLMEYIFTAASEADVLDDGLLIDTLIAWLGTMSTSNYRAFRHTATTMVLMIMGQIARLNQEARKEFEQLSKQRDSQTSKSNPARYKSFNEKISQVNAKRKMLDDFHKELDEAVFIHRYRDSDPTIRADCMEELGRWMRICPAQFLNKNYMRYYAWELSDENATVRLVVVHALKALYMRQSSSSALETFTERFLTRMIEMATGDIDLSVRVAMIDLLLCIDQTSTIEDDEARDSICRHIFDNDVKVRNAVSRFFSHIVEEQIDKEDEEVNKIRFKSMAELLIRLNDKIDGSASRIPLALESILSIPEYHHQTDLIDLLLLDHSSNNSVKGRQKMKNVRKEYHLTVEEEDILLESLRILLNGFDDIMIVNAMPKFFNKYKTEAKRICSILSLIPQMDLQLFQRAEAYENLWDMVIDQFERHTESEVIDLAAIAISSMNKTKALNTINEDKLIVLRENLMSSLKDSISSFEPLIGTRNLPQDNLHRLIACTSRVKSLFRLIDLTSAIDESNEDDPDESGIWDTLLACAQSSLSEKQEECKLVENAIVIMALYIVWKTNTIVSMDDQQSKVEQAELLMTKRQKFLSSCERILDASSNEGNRVAQRQAFRNMLDIYIIYANLVAMDEERLQIETNAISSLPTSLYLSCSSRVQDIMSNFVSNESETSSSEINLEDSEDEFKPLQAENELAYIVSHYVGAIRLGIIDVRKSIEILAEYGRMGELYDACLRVLVESIREVGIQGKKPGIACTILRETLTIAKRYVARDNENDENKFVNLSKMLSSCLVVRGAQLRILQVMDANEVVKMHEILIDQAVREVKSDESRLEELVMFKALSQLLISLEPNEALKIKVAIDRTLQEHQVEIPSNEKAWDSLRSYEKRIVTIASKSSSVTRKLTSASILSSKRKHQRSADEADETFASSAIGDDDAEGEEENPFEEQSLIPANTSTSIITSSKPRPKPRAIVNSQSSTIPVASQRTF